ncbi:RNA-binding protein Musashi homolog 2-like [Sycon ciliatum]|uniref:RNA-binding protein Musashi homolog 2-like n=1 Tax=Sycon ciliatum TaxID=27933 RepID=UPI0031F5FB8F
MEEEGKIFVGGLSWDTKEDGLTGYFQSFGEVASCVIMRDANTQRSRGFGFVTFRETATVGKVLKAASHLLDGRKIDPKPAVPRGSQPPPVGRAPNGVPRGRPGPEGGRPWQPTAVMGPPGAAASRGPYTGPTKKIFVGGLSPTTTEEDVKSFFSTHGTVTEVILKYDQTNNRMRGFGFVTFDTESVVDELVSKHYVQINTKTVEIKKAEPRNQSNGPNPQFMNRSVPYWDPAYYPYPRGGYGPPPNSGAPYYPNAAYAASPTAAYNGPSYPAYSTGAGAYGASHYGGSGAAPSYGSAGYPSYATTGGYGNASAGGYESYNGSSGQSAHRSSYHTDSGYGAASSGAPAGAYAAENHSPVAPMPYASGGASSSYGQQAAAPSTVTTSSADVHQYAAAAAAYSNEYRSAPATAGPSYAQQSTVGPTPAQQGQQRQYAGY